MKDIIPIIKKTANLIHKINTASQEYNNGAMQINDAVQKSLDYATNLTE